MNINQMNASLLGLFSGFPTHHFPDEIAQVLRENLSRRESLVFISAWPEEYARNDDDSDGMHGMFAERGMAFADHRVIDRRTSAADAVRLAREADCIFLMGGDVTKQMSLIRDLGLVAELRASRAVILGVSAGSMNMGRYAADVWETKERRDRPDGHCHEGALCRGRVVYPDIERIVQDSSDRRHGG